MQQPRHFRELPHLPSECPVRGPAVAPTNSPFSCVSGKAADDTGQVLVSPPGDVRSELADRRRVCVCTPAFQTIKEKKINKQCRENIFKCTISTPWSILCNSIKKKKAKSRKRCLA